MGMIPNSESAGQMVNDDHVQTKWYMPFNKLVLNLYESHMDDLNSLRSDYRNLNMSSWLRAFCRKGKIPMSSLEYNVTEMALLW